MKNKDLFATLVLDYEEEIRNSTIIDRNLKVDLSSQKPLAIIGPRRSGKTFFLYSLFKKMSALYLLLDDDRIYPPKLEDLKIIHELSLELERDSLLLDEIQEVDNWELFVKRVSNTQKVVLTGSSSKLLSKEIATNLRGRCLSYELLPFSFKEFLKIKKFSIKKHYSTAELVRLKRFFNDFLQFGGFPEVILYDEKEKIIKEYLEVMFFKDIVERYDIKNTKALRIFLNLLIHNFTKEFSVNNAFGTLKNIGVKIGKNYLYDYLGYFHDAYIIFPLHKFCFSVSKRKKSIPKIYLIDGLSYILFRHSEDKGKLLENLVFLELRKQGYRENEHIFYFKENQECDFVIFEDQKIQLLIQVTYELNEESEQREVQGLSLAMEKLKSKKAIILTYDQEKKITVSNKTIQVLPVWKFLLGLVKKI